MRRIGMPWGDRLSRPFEGLAGEMESLFNRFFNSEGAPTGPGFAPVTNVAESEAGYEVSMDLPGMKAEEVGVELKDNVLYVYGERKEDLESAGKTYIKLERTYGKFRRSIPLPGGVDADRIDAQFRDGILTIQLPKRPEVMPKQIKVNDASAHPAY